jgi:hypothetical protein
MTTGKIAATSDGRCVERAISTMRAALGYETGLPDDWPNLPHKSVPTVIGLCDLAFPDREVLVWCNKKRHWRPGVNSLYQGEAINRGPQWDGYLFAFVYEGSDYAHMVVGWPTAYGDMKITLAVGVRMDFME